MAGSSKTRTRKRKQKLAKKRGTRKTKRVAKESTMPDLEYVEEYDEVDNNDNNTEQSSEKALDHLMDDHSSMFDMADKIRTKNRQELTKKSKNIEEQSKRRNKTGPRTEVDRLEEEKAKLRAKKAEQVREREMRELLNLQKEGKLDKSILESNKELNARHLALSDMNLKDVAVLVVATGSYYRKCAIELIASCEKHWLCNRNKCYYVFTDLFKESAKEQFIDMINKKYNKFYEDDAVIDADRIVFIPTYPQGFPNMALYKYHFFIDYYSENEDKFESVGMIYMLDPTMLCVNEIKESMMTPQNSSQTEFTDHRKEIVAVRHSSFPYCSGTVEQNTLSSAYVDTEYYSQTRVYYRSSVVGASRNRFVSMANELVDAINCDDSVDVIAEFHDESHLNRYLFECRDNVQSLPMTFCFPDFNENASKKLHDRWFAMETKLGRKRHKTKLRMITRNLEASKYHDALKAIGQRPYITCDLNGGLGNQMFQAAATLVMARELKGVEVTVQRANKSESSMKRNSKKNKQKQQHQNIDTIISGQFMPLFDQFQHKPDDLAESVLGSSSGDSLRSGIDEQMESVDDELDLAGDQTSGVRASVGLFEAKSSYRSSMLHGLWRCKLDIEAENICKWSEPSELEQYESGNITYPQLEAVDRGDGSEPTMLPLYICGNFQNWNYINGHRKYVLDRLIPKRLDSLATKFYQKIYTETSRMQIKYLREKLVKKHLKEDPKSALLDSDLDLPTIDELDLVTVAIHISRRVRKDTGADKRWKRVSKYYYQYCIDDIDSREDLPDAKNILWMIFSDDIAYCRGRSMFKKLRYVQFVDTSSWSSFGVYDSDAFELLIRSKCNVHICCNSAYSVWAPWISKRYKISNVYLPDTQLDWYTDFATDTLHRQPHGLVMDHWTIVDRKNYCLQ